MIVAVDKISVFATSSFGVKMQIARNRFPYDLTRVEVNSLSSYKIRILKFFSQGRAHQVL